MRRRARRAELESSGLQTGGVLSLFLRPTLQLLGVPSGPPACDCATPQRRAPRRRAGLLTCSCPALCLTVDMTCYGARVFARGMITVVLRVALALHY